MQLIYVHIPKTAGSTFRNVLKKQYKKRHSFFIHDFYPEYSINYLNQLSNVEIEKYNVIGGHCTQFLRNRGFAQKKVVYLRNPINQILSGFYHVKRSVFNKSHKGFQSLNTVEEFLTYSEENGGFNGQVNYLSIKPELFFNGLPNDLPIEQQLIKAKEFIESCNYVFITEEFDESLMILQSELNWQIPYYLAKNVSANRDRTEKDDKIVQRLEEGQKYDFELYRYAIEKYNFLKSKHAGNDLDIQTQDFIRKNKVYNDVHRPISNISSQFIYMIDRLGILKPSWKKPPVY